MAEPAWQELLRLRLAERKCPRVPPSPPFIIEQQQTKLLKERNASLLARKSRPCANELATVYKPRAKNAQRLPINERTLREKEELSRVDSESLRKTRDEIAVLRRKVDQHSELMAEKDRTVQLGQIEERNQTLTKDNAKLLQRWLDAKQAEANR
ncbi:hypothetical protein B0H14DRAFT_3080469 [Mycena olivaceomarginata]|nr:hypothetical protein B0H14DRAFT_3080469 [Mycena olivaceomarginata]